MWMTEYVRNCDFTGTEYDEPVVGAWALAQGATGRYCCVMWAGPEYVAENGIKPISREEAERQIEEMGDAWADF